jgi:hypothetical protein
VIFNSVLEDNETFHGPFTSIYIRPYVHLDIEDENADYYQAVEEAEAEEGLLATYQYNIGLSVLDGFNQISVDNDEVSSIP